MFITLRSSNITHIDVQPLHGRGGHHHVVEEHIGDTQIQMLVDPTTQTVFWLDSDRGRIEFSNYEGSYRHLFRRNLKKPVSIALVDEDIVWSSYGSKIMYYTHKSNMASIKKFQIEIPSYISFRDEILLVASKPLQTLKHKCLHDNGGCSHICVSLGRYAAACLCPPGKVFKDNLNMTCIDALDCEFRCKSGECLTLSRHCNNYIDCADGSDEKGCGENELEKVKIVCAYDQFACHDGAQCVSNEARCNHVYDCKDKSDENHCERFDYKKKCHEHQFFCENSRCVDLTAVCDGFNDCGDGSDEDTCGENTNSRSKICGKNMFVCTSGSCISKEWECDGHLDCPDGSDEHDKCVHNECAEGFVQCHLGTCIDKALECDGHNDCGDNSDELNCGEKMRKMVCGDETDNFGDRTKFQCFSEPALCLDIKAKCNGTAECPRGEDEIGCLGCNIYEFQCKSSNECIRKEFRCDNEKDCPDGSDEFNCGEHNFTASHFATICLEGMFNCKDGTCVDQLRVCDGIHDCEGGEDESVKCQTACEKHFCEQKCTPSPYGAICSCNEGYQLKGDKRSCFDVNECLEANPCAQICQNTYGSFRCGCFGEFMLRSDKTSCKSIESQHYILFSSANQIRKLSENPLTLKILWSINDTRISGFDINVRTNKAYFSIQDSLKLNEYDLNTNKIVVIDDDGFKGKIAVDWITNNVYVIDYSERYSIKVCDFHKVNACAVLIKFAPRDVVKSLATDAVNKYLFYVIIHYFTFGDPQSVIYRSGLDGSRREVVLSVPGYITAIECDIYKKELYFIDFYTKTLQMVEYDGKTAKIIIKRENAIINPSGLSIYENTAFIVNTGFSEAVKCQLYGEKKCQVVNLNVYNAENIVIAASSRQRKVANTCENNNCSFICVQADLGAKCICNNGDYVQPNVQCSKSISNEVNLSLMKVSKADANSLEGGIATSICLTIIFGILLGLFGYLYYRKRSGSGNFNINMHFQNPLGHFNNINQDRSKQGASKFYRPIQRFLQSEKVSEISLDMEKEDTFKSLNGTNAIRISADDLDNESSQDIENLDDNPTARLVL